MTSPLLVAALSFGSGCAGLHRLDGERTSIVSRPPAEGPAAAFGQARMPQPGTIAWVAPPMVVGGLHDRVQAHAAAAAAAEWIRATAQAAQRS